jgi:hypothetical protein
LNNIDREFIVAIDMSQSGIRSDNKNFAVVLPSSVLAIRAVDAVCKKARRLMRFIY